MFFPNIRNLREDADLTQKQLGEILHVSQRCYSYYETGKHDIPLEILIRIAEYYNVSLDYLVGRSAHKEILR